MTAEFSDWDSYFLPEPKEPEESRVLRNLTGRAEQFAAFLSQVVHAL